jgi:hypothetical protein
MLLRRRPQGIAYDATVAPTYRMEAARILIQIDANLGKYACQRIAQERDLRVPAGRRAR